MAITITATTVITIDTKFSIFEPLSLGGCDLVIGPFILNVALVQVAVAGGSSVSWKTVAVPVACGMILAGVCLVPQEQWAGVSYAGRQP